MGWLEWFEANKHSYSMSKYGRQYASLTHLQIQVLQDEMACYWIDNVFNKKNKGLCIKQ